jgi:predicted  nucleic acid-binding Zn-ribbon protein
LNRSYSEQADGMKVLDNLVDKLDNETNELKRLATETNQRVEELKTAVIQVNSDLNSFLFYFHMKIFVFFL